MDEKTPKNSRPELRLQQSSKSCPWCATSTQPESEQIKLFHTSHKVTRADAWMPPDHLTMLVQTS